MALYRNNNTPIRVRDSTLITCWAEAEILRLKLLGLPFASIARQITEVGRGQKSPLTPLPPEIIFPANYRITLAACHKAFYRVLEREPRLGVRELRRLNTQRCEAMLLALQPAVQKGDPRAVVAAIRVLDFQATINNLKSRTELDDSPVLAPPTPTKLPPGIVHLFAGAVAILIEHNCLPDGFTCLPPSDPNAIETTATKSRERD
jgi:hypothetical protein